MDRDVPEGRPWRNMLDMYAKIPWGERFDSILRGNVGLEPGNFGASKWIAASAYIRFKMLPWWYCVLRADTVIKSDAQSDQGNATPLFWPSQWVSGASFGMDFRTLDFLLFRIEYRHDQSRDPMYFDSTDFPGADGIATASGRSQDLLIFGFSSWI